MATCMTDIDLPTVQDVRNAARRIGDTAVRTPLLRVPGRKDLWVKCENLQRTGSFKFRGAMNALAAQRERIANGVVACSSGNHAQGVAEAARLHGVPATIVMPRDAPTAKRARTERAGATVRPYERFTEDREAIAGAIARDTGALFVHPFEDPFVIAGQGTCGLEIAADLDALDVAFVCAGGGGFMAGITLALRERFPDVAVAAVEPDGFDDQTRSLRMGERQAIVGGRTSICDAILTERPGELAFAITRDVAHGATVTDDEALAAMAFAFEELKLVVEPGGAVALAAMLRADAAGALEGRTAVATLSGGNVDADVLHRALAGPRVF